ncbi:hypothetical protein ILUMI_00439 [Ignelater luminosus]|uniref:Uncharacterized protein n=1 Tax=Ignelater luminosus TaxID=2038154 RepID=A0A8K0DK75_IGNLU|nr:hypothetical protein ILUMI_00439 [Ignelater luminosus]
MGSTSSKIMNESKDGLSENSIPSAPVLTPQIRRLELDPRSPSSDIARTPIEVLKTPATTANNSLNITEDLSDCTEREIYTDLDPRSPTTEFHRTPIIIDNIPKDMPLRNKNLERVLMPAVAITPIKPKKISERVIRKIYDSVGNDSTKTVSPRLLESKPVIIAVPENKRNSVVGLLETNIDFIETDLDAVIQSKMKKHEPSLDDENISSTDAESMKSSEQSLENVNNVDIMNYDNQTDNSVEIIIADSQRDEEKTENNNTPEEFNKISDFNTKTVVSVDELNRKLTNLIYEDRQCEISPKANRPVTTHRTPLGDRNANSQQRRSIPVLKVSDKPTKSVASRIPIFKEKKGKAKINVQCENTPPRMQVKRSQWGAEDSLII